MSKRQLQRDIKLNGGYVLSDGTCNLQHLLPKAYDLIVGYRLHSQGIAAEIRNVVSATKPTFMSSRWGPGYHYSEAADYLWNEDIYEYFNDIAPRGFYFGSSEGDGACIGWFRYEEEE